MNSKLDYEIKKITLYFGFGGLYAKFALAGIFGSDINFFYFIAFWGIWAMLIGLTVIDSTMFDKGE